MPDMAARSLYQRTKMEQREMKDRKKRDFREKKERTRVFLFLFSMSVGPVSPRPRPRPSLILQPFLPACLRMMRFSFLCCKITRYTHKHYLMDFVVSENILYVFLDFWFFYFLFPCALALCRCLALIVVVVVVAVSFFLPFFLVLPVLVRNSNA